MCEGRGGEPSQACTCIDVRCCTHTLPGASTHPAPSPTHAPTSQGHTLDPFYRVHTRRLRRSTSSWSCWSARTRGAACGSTQSGASVSATAVPASAVCCGASVGATAVCLPLLCAVRHLPGHECRAVRTSDQGPIGACPLSVFYEGAVKTAAHASTTATVAACPVRTAPYMHTHLYTRMQARARAHAPTPPPPPTVCAQIALSPRW